MDQSGSLYLTESRNIFPLSREVKFENKYYYIPNKSEEILKNLEENNIQLIVLAGFMSILSKEFTKKYENRIINIHPSLIPSFCGEGFYGLHVHEAALKKGVKVTGATVHIVNEIPDGGPIIMQRAVYIEENDTPETLQKRVMEQAEWKILPESVELMCSGKVKIENGRTYCNE